MIIHPCIAETVISAGTGVVFGTKENYVRCPDTDGSGDYIGVFAYDPKKPEIAAGERIGITLSGVVSPNLKTCYRR